MQFNAKVAQLEQENALLHQQLEWQPRPQPQQQMPQPQPQRTQQIPQEQVAKPQWKPFGKLRPKGRGFNPLWNRKQLDAQPPNSNQNDKGNLRCHGCGQKGHFRKDCLAEGLNMNHLTEESDEESQVNLRRDSNPYQYDVVNDFRWTPTNTFFEDLVQIPKYRESLQQYLAAIERKNQREVKHTTLEEKPVYRSYVKLGRHSLQAQWDTGAQISVCTKPLATKLGLKWAKLDKELNMVTIDGKKSPSI